MTTRQAGRTTVLLLLALMLIGGCAGQAAPPKTERPQTQLRFQRSQMQQAQEPPNGREARLGSLKADKDRPAPEARPERLGKIRKPGPAALEYRSDPGMVMRPGTPMPPSATAKPRALADRRAKVPEGVRGIYVSGWVAGGSKSMERMIRLVERTDLNAMVIDVKNDYGLLTYRSNLAEVKRIGADAQPTIRDMGGLIKRLKASGIYTIGRVVVFKDPFLAKARDDWAFHTKDGKLWRDRKGKAWVDPFHADVRAYNVAIAKEAAALGFDEIQFDYVRFPDNGEEMDRVVRYRNEAGLTKRAVIGRFLQDAREALHDSETVVSADVFGMVTSARDDMGIGQTWREIAPVVDVISPMIYPSHYGSGMYGVRYPDLQPARIVGRALADAEERNRWLRGEGRDPAVVRPWLQAFTARWLDRHQPYKESEIREQIRAAESAGVRQFLLWNPACKYDYSPS